LDLKKTFDVVDHSFVISWKISFTWTLYSTSTLTGSPNENNETACRKTLSMLSWLDRHVGLKSTKITIIIDIKGLWLCNATVNNISVYLPEVSDNL
jgi:hypothetical protein